MTSCSKPATGDLVMAVYRTTIGIITRVDDIYMDVTTWKPAFKSAPLIITVFWADTGFMSYAEDDISTSRVMRVIS